MKRKEATLEQWKELYELAVEVKELEPWMYLWDMDIITIMLPEYDEPFYCSIMGRNSEFYGIGIYDGFEAMDAFYKLSNASDIPPDQLIRYQNCFMCNYGNREELTKKEWKLVKDLGYKFRGKNNWIYFHAYKKGYVPYMLDQEQVILLIEVFKGLIMSLRALIYQGIEVDFENQHTLFRYYNDEKNLWLNMDAPLAVPPVQYPIPVLEDDLLIKRLNKQKSIQTDIELDIAYLNTSINDPNYDSPIIPRANLIADHKLGTVIDMEMLAPDNDDVQEIFNILINYILKSGKPKTIFVRDDYIKSILMDLCERVQINLKIKGCLPAIDNFLREFSEDILR